MNDLAQIMNHGLVIFQDHNDPNGTATVKKIATPISPTDILHNEVGPNCSVKDFPSHDAACDFCLKFISGGIEEANLTECHVQLAYNPTGYALKVKNLDKVKAANPEEAHSLGMEQVVAFFKEQGITKKVGDSFELKVIPVR